MTVKAAPVVASAIADLTLEVGGTRDITLSSVFGDADGDALTLIAVSSSYAVASMWVDGSTLTVGEQARGRPRSP